MRHLVLSLAAATAISVASLAPANAITIGTGAAQAIQSAVEDENLVQDVAYVCRHRGYSSRRVCFWQPGGGGYYRGYRGGYRGNRYGGWRRW